MSLYIYEQHISDGEKQEHCDAVAKWLSAIDLGMTPEGVNWSYETISNRYQKVEHTATERSCYGRRNNHCNMEGTHMGIARHQTSQSFRTRNRSEIQ